MSHAINVSHSVMGYLERLRDDKITWKQRLFDSFLKYAMEGKAAYAKIIVDALSQEAPEDLESLGAVDILESEDPLTFNSELREYMSQRGRFGRFIEAMVSFAITGKAAFARFVVKLAQVKPPKKKEIKGKSLVVDAWGGLVAIVKNPPFLLQPTINREISAEPSTSMPPPSDQPMKEPIEP